jgi:zinc protease
MAQNVFAFQQSSALDSVFGIVATARPGHTLDAIRKVIDEELETLRQTPPSERELERSLNGIEAEFYGAIERVHGFGGRADQLNAYLTATGNPDYFAEDLGRYQALSVTDLQTAVQTWLPADRRVELSVVPATPASKE